MSAEMNPLPSFPVDDVTLDALDHAIDAYLDFNDEDGNELPDGPRVVGADMTVPTLLDFLSGSMGMDPNGFQLEPGVAGLPGIEGAEVWMDTRPHYTRDDVIRALIREVRRLRSEGGAA